jgi:hypothetical protein
METERILLLVGFGIWLIGTIIAYARRDRHAEIRARFWGSHATTGKIVIFAMLWWAWAGWAMLLDEAKAEKKEGSDDITQS